MKSLKRWVWVLGLLAVTWVAGFVTALTRAEPQRHRGARSQVSQEPAPASAPRSTGPATRAASAQTEPGRPRLGRRPSPHAVFLAPGGDPLKASIPELDLALEIEGKNEPRQGELLLDAQRMLANQPTVRQMSARCGATFCRLRIDRSVGTDWELIDEALRPIMLGEMIFQTEDAEDGTSLAYVYVSEPDAHLPLSLPEQEREGM